MHSNSLKAPCNPPVLFNFFEVSKDGDLTINAAVIRIEIQKRLSKFYYQHSNSLSLKSALLEPQRDAFIHDCTQFFESINSIKKDIFRGIQQHLGKAQYQSTEKEISENISIYLIDALDHLISIENNGDFNLDSPTISKILAISPQSEKFNQMDYLLGIFENLHDSELAPKAGHGPSFDEIRGLHLFSAIICHQIILENSSSTKVITYISRFEIQKRLSGFYHQHSNSLTLKSALLEPERDAFIHDCTQFFESINSIKKDIFKGIQQHLGEAQYQSTEKEISENITIYLIDALNKLIKIQNNRIFKSSMISKKDALSSCIDNTYLKIDQNSTFFDDGDYNLDSPTIKSKILAISPQSEKFNQMHYLLGIFENSHDDELAPKAGHAPSFDEIRGLHLFSAIICHQIILGNSSNTNIITYIKRFLTDSSFSNLLKDYDFKIYNLRKNNYINHNFCMGSMLCSLIQLDEDVLSKFLIKMGYSLLQTDQLQRTPLHLAVLRKNYELIELIKKYSIGSRYASFFTLVSQRDRSSYRKTAFDYALINQDIKAMSLLFHENLFFASSFERATFVNPLHRVASIPNFNQDILNFLFKKNVYLDPQDLKERASPAMIAYKNHQYSVAQKFIAAGASVVLTDINGESLIFYAIQHALSDEIAAEHVSLILDKKSWFDNLDIVSTNRETHLKKTPLMLAFELQYFKACSLLIDKGFSKIVNGEDKILNIPKNTLGKLKELIKQNKTDDALDLYGTLINERLFINEYLLTNQYFQNMARSRFSFFNFFFNFFFSSFFSFSHNLNSIGRVNYSARLKMLKKNVKIRFAEQLVEHDDSITPHSIENSPPLILPSKVRKITINHDSLNTELDDRLAHRQ